MRADDSGAEDAAVLGCHHLDMSVSLAFGLRTIVLVIGPAQYADRLVALACLRFGEARMRKLGIGECHPWDCVMTRLGRQAKQRVPDDDAGMIVRHMGKVPTRRVADRVG